jgi:hypothetical protein
MCALHRRSKAIYRAQAHGNQPHPPGESPGCARARRGCAQRFLVTNVPLDGRVRTRPRSRRSLMARRAVISTTPYSAARSRSPGSRVPGGRSPASIRAVMCSATASHRYPLWHAWPGVLAGVLYARRPGSCPPMVDRRRTAHKSPRRTEHRLKAARKAPRTYGTRPGAPSIVGRSGEAELGGTGRGCPRSTLSPGIGLAAVGVQPPAHLTAGFCVRMRGLLPAAAVKGSSPQRADGGTCAWRLGNQRPLPVAAWYCSTTLAGMRPRSLTAMPWSFAQARMSPLR